MESTHPPVVEEPKKTDVYRWKSKNNGPMLINGYAIVQKLSLNVCGCELQGFKHENGFSIYI